MTGTLAVRVQPRAARNEIVGERAGVLVVRLTAPPIENRANDALRRLLAEHLRVPPSRISLLRGARSRDKLVQIDGLTSEEIARALALSRK